MLVFLETFLKWELNIFLYWNENSKKTSVFTENSVESIYSISKQKNPVTLIKHYYWIYKHIFWGKKLICVISYKSW